MSLGGKKPLCEQVPPRLVGPLVVKTTPPPLFTSAFNATRLLRNNKEWKRHYGADVAGGGEWRPRACTARHRLAVIVPYRDRAANLDAFLYHMHPLLQRQQLAYRVFVVEQVGGSIFNKGILMNTAFLQAFTLANFSTEFITSRPGGDDLNLDNRHFPFDCFVFHDVDLLPEGTVLHNILFIQLSRH